MRKYFVFILLFFLINCKENKPKINLNFNNTDIVTVTDIFSITFTPEYPNCITELGANLLYDNSVFEFVVDSTKLYNIFEFEVINPIESGRIALGLSSTNPVCSFTTNKYIFSIYFKIKDYTISESMMWLENITILDKDGNNIIYEEGTNKINLKIAQAFKMNWIIKQN